MKTWLITGCSSGLGSGEVIVDTILSGKMPSRLLLGSDAVQAAQNVLKDRLQETENWMDVSRRSDYR